MPISTKFTRTLPLVSLLALAPAVLVLRVPHPPEVVVGVFDVGLVVEQNPRYLKLRKQSVALRVEYEANLVALAKKLDAFRVSIPEMAAGSEARADRENEYALLRHDHEYRGKRMADRLRQAELRNTLNVYEEIDYAIAQVAERRGISLVLPKQDIPRANPSVAALDRVALQRHVQTYDRRQVWHASKKLDLTSDLITFLMNPLPDLAKPEAAKK